MGSECRLSSDARNAEVQRTETYIGIATEMLPCTFCRRIFRGVNLV